ncbi:hypothetical protein HO607_01830 [Streptococcus suis]|nr:hypothetical protein [Streptococcus suis]
MRKKIAFDIDGVIYYGYQEVADAFGLKIGTITNRYQKGIRGKELVAPLAFEVSHRFKGATIQGTEYKSLSAISKAFDIPEITLRDRYKAGKRDDELVETYRASFPGITIRGRFYSSIKEIAETFDLPLKTLQKRYKKGARGEDLISTKRLYYNPRSTSKHKNIYYNKVKKLYVYHTMYKDKHYEWARKSFDDILSVKEQVEVSLKNDRAIPKILDPQANKDYIKLLPVGSVIGQWTVLDVFKKQGRYYANCQCSCGKIKDVYGASLTSGQSTNCGHVLQSLMTTKDYQNYAHSMQHKRKEPNVNNKLKERYISLDKRGRYYVSLTRYGLNVRQYFYSIAEAIEFRDKLLDDVNKNDGKIPRHYPTKPRP